MTTPGMTIDQRIAKARKAKRKRLWGRIALYVVSATIGLGVGTVLVDATEADAASQTQINRYIRLAGGVAPCTHEDGSRQTSPCFWDASQRGNGKGYDYIALTVKGQDDAIVYLTGPKAKRY